MALPREAIVALRVFPYLAAASAQWLLPGFPPLAPIQDVVHLPPLGGNRIAVTRQSVKLIRDATKILLLIREPSRICP